LPPADKARSLNDSITLSFPFDSDYRAQSGNFRATFVWCLLHVSHTEALLPFGQIGSEATQTLAEKIKKLKVSLEPKEINDEALASRFFIRSKLFR
jgi:hypothetical protein